MDVAILIAYGTEHAFDYLEFKVQLERRLNRDVDLVLLNQAGEIIKYLIRRDGVRVFERDPRKRKDWEIRSRKMYQDYLHLHQICKVCADASEFKMVNTEIFERLCTLIQGYIQELEQAQDIDWTKFSQDNRSRRFVERMLQITVEAMIKDEDQNA